MGSDIERLNKEIERLDYEKLDRDEFINHKNFTNLHLDGLRFEIDKDNETTEKFNIDEFKISSRSRLESEIDQINETLERINEV